MVKIAIYTAIITLIITISGAHAQERQNLTGDDVRELLRKSEGDHAKRNQQLKYNEMHHLYNVRNRPGASSQKGESIPVIENKLKENYSESADKNKEAETGNHHAPAQNNGEGKTPSLNQTGHPTAVHQNHTGVTQSKGTPTNRKFQKDRYMPPSWGHNQSAGGFGVDQVKKTGPQFGIRIGTRIYGELRRSVSNAERNMCEIYITKNAIGDSDTLQQGTIIFAVKEFNNSTKLLELRTVKGITPDGKEFPINAYGMDMNEVAGLSGTITSDGNQVKRSIGVGGYAVGQSLAAALNNGTVMGAGVEAATQNMLSEKQAETGERLSEPRYIIRVDPQPVILMVSKTF